MSTVGPFSPEPVEVARSADGTPIAIFQALPDASASLPASVPARTRPPLLLVHGTTADHTTWRVVAPTLAARRTVYAMDRRGRGASGDGPAYAIEREFEDVAAAAAVLAAPGGTIDALGHSYGGRSVLGASLRTSAIRKLVVYEGAPVPPGVAWADESAAEAVTAAVRRGNNALALETFFRTIVGMDDEAIARFRADPVWPVRVAAAPTLVREMEGEAEPAAGLEALGRVRVPVLQLLGTASPQAFRIGTDALAARLADGIVATIDGAAHAAHHTHPGEFVAAVESFLDAPLEAGRILAP